MAEETQQENAVRSGDDVTCPNCGSHNVRCIPYPKAEFGIWFVPVSYTHLDVYKRQVHAPRACVLLAELQQRQQIFDRRRCQGFLCIRHTAALPIARFG